MKAADIAALRKLACQTIAALGEIVDSLQTIDEVIQTPSKEFAPDVDQILIVARLNDAVEAAERFQDAAGDLTQHLIAHQIAAEESQPMKGGA